MGILINIRLTSLKVRHSQECLQGKLRWCMAVFTLYWVCVAGRCGSVFRLGWQYMVLSYLEDMYDFETLAARPSLIGP
jgi:hypothetical protein